MLIAGIGSWRIMLSMFASAMSFAFILNLIGSSTNPMFALSPAWHLVLGGFAFGMVFMATDPITSPITIPGRIYFGFAFGFLTFIIRIFGAYPEGVMFAILIMNMFVSSFDYYKWTNSKITKKQKIIFSIIVLLSIAVTLVGVSYV